MDPNVFALCCPPEQVTVAVCCWVCEPSGLFVVVVVALWVCCWVVCCGAGSLGFTTLSPGAPLFDGLTVVGSCAGETGISVVDDAPCGAGLVVPAGAICCSGASGLLEGSPET